MATLSEECNQEIAAIQKVSDQRDSSSALIADCNEPATPSSRDRQQPAAIELIKTQVTNAIAVASSAKPNQPNKAAAAAECASASCQLNSLTNLNGTKITGKLVAVRKDGNSYTFTTTASAVSGSSAKTFTLATPSAKGGNTLITVAKPQHLTLSGGGAGGSVSGAGKTLIATGSPPQHRLYYNKTTNTIEHSIASLNQGTTTTTQDDLQTASNNNKINTSKPIILQMKRKIQVLNDENRKTARIFTIPSSANLINKQSNQFIVMNRARSASLLAGANGSSIKAKMASLAKPITANLSVLDRASLSISNSISNASRSSPSSSSSSVSTSSGTGTVTGETAASITIVTKPMPNSTALLNKLTTTAEHLVDNKIKPKLDAKMLSIESEMSAGGATGPSFARPPAGYLSTIERSACLPNLAANNSASNLLSQNDGDNKIVEVDAENLLGEKEEAEAEAEEETAVELAEETVQEMVENYDCQSAIDANVSGPLQHCFVLDDSNKRTTMENLIESTIESSFESSSGSSSAANSAASSAHRAIGREQQDTCVDSKSVSSGGNNTPNCIKIAQDIEFNPNSSRSNGLARERSVSLGSLTNGGCPPVQQQFSMQT